MSKVNLSTPPAEAVIWRCSKPRTLDIAGDAFELLMCQLTFHVKARTWIRAREIAAVVAHCAPDELTVWVPHPSILEAYPPKAYFDEAGVLRPWGWRG